MEKDWAATDYKKAYDIYKEKFANAGNFHFYFVGNIDEAKFKNEVLQYIASLPSSGKATNFKDTGYRSLTGDHTKVYKKGKDPRVWFKSYIPVMHLTMKKKRCIVCTG